MATKEPKEPEVEESNMNTEAPESQPFISPSQEVTEDTTLERTDDDDAVDTGADDADDEKRNSLGMSAESGDRELYLSEFQKEEFVQALKEEGIEVPTDEYGKPVFTKRFVKSLPKRIAREIMTAAYEMDDVDSGSGYSDDDDNVESRKSRITEEQISDEPVATILEIRYTPSGLGYISDQSGEKIAYEEIVKLLDGAFTESKPSKVSQKPSSAVEKTASQKTMVHLLDPRDLQLGRVDSFATVPSTIERKFSNATVRGSMLSTKLSDMPSTYSMMLGEEPSMMAMITPNEQQFDITPASASKFREKWLADYLVGFTPKETFTISIINLITRRSIELRVCREYTLNEICHLYMVYDDHPEYYVWKDIYGRVLIPDRTLIDNGMMTQDEKMEFQGYRKLPVIILHFRDGLENDPSAARGRLQGGVCRNY